MTRPSVTDPLRIRGRLIGGKYEVEQAIGEGGFSIVYRALHRTWNHAVALKCFVGLAGLPRESRPALLEAFVREGEIMARLSSRIPEIVQARDVGDFTAADGVWVPYLVLEWLDGASLDVFLARARAQSRGGWSVDEVVELLRGPFRALARVHGEGIAHRDIKPANLFVVGAEPARGTTIKLLDFGVAKLMHAGADDPASTGIGGRSFTPGYGAPEQFDRVHGPTGPWTDVFAAALVMVEMLRGGIPALDGDDFGQLGWASQNPNERPTPRTLGVEVSDAVEAVFGRALAVDPDARYRDVGEMWSALESAVATPRVLTGGSATSPTIIGLAPPPRGVAPEPAVEARIPPVGRRRVVVGIAAVTSILAVAAGARIVQRGESAADEAVGASASPVEVKGTRADAAPPTEPRADAACPSGTARIEGGKFWMGSDRDHPALVTAHPPHRVDVAPFCLDVHEVTVAAYRACSATGECKRASRDTWWPRGQTEASIWTRERSTHDALCNEGRSDAADHPANCVTWPQADAFCRQLGRRLPSEAEWEFAARGSDGRVYPWGDQPPDPRRANVCGDECRVWREHAGLPAVHSAFTTADGFVGTAPVGAFVDGRTQWGPLDMVGNVFEWVDDPFAPYAGATAPHAPLDGTRVIRGGAFNSYLAEFADPALRFGADPQTRSPAIGFRCAADTGR